MSNINFLLGSSQTDLTSYRLARMGEAANLRKEIQKLLDKLREVDLLVQLSLCSNTTTAKPSSEHSEPKRAQPIGQSA